MQCFQCDQEAQQECPRCGALYCDAHGEALCEHCMNPALALPSYKVYRGSLAALLIASVFAIWLLVIPPAGADRDAPPSALAGFLSTSTPEPGGSGEGTPTATPTLGATVEPSPSATTPTPTATATPEPTETPTPEPDEPIEYTVQPGDTMLLIAQEFLPPGRTADEFAAEIAELNGIADPSLISVGQVLQIPQ